MGARMIVKEEYLTAVNKLFRTRTVVLLEDLLQALKRRSAVTVFHVLKVMGYYNSYSHSGRYYTLERIPQFDDRGLWHYRDIGFSRHGTLRATIVYFVDQSLAGCTHEELEAILKLQVHNTLLFLVNTEQLRREPFRNGYVYVSAQRARAAQQIAERQKLAAVPPEDAVPEVAGEFTRTVVIDLLLDVIRHPEHDAKAVCRQLGKQGHWITPEQVENVFRHYDLKKTPRSRSPRSRR
jgi:hypothetical protein